MSAGESGRCRTPAASLLVVDDDPQLRSLLVEALESYGFAAQDAACGEAALDRLKDWEPDVVLLDVRMPGIGGVETCRQMREQSTVPIIMLTALGRDEDIVAGLEAGADDYCTKPLSLDQLVARIRAQLRRRALDAATPEIAGLEKDELVVDPAERRAIIKGRPVELSHREFDLLYRLAQSPGRVVSHEDLLEHVWGTRGPERRTSLRSCIKLLRQKVEPDPHHPRYIRSRPLTGYVLAMRRVEDWSA